MNIEIARALGTLQGMVNDFFALLPTLGIALLVFGASYYAAKGLKALVSRVTARRQHHRNLGLVLGRVSQWLMVFVGLLGALVILFPSFKVADVVQLLGIGGVAIGFAFRDILQNFLAGLLLLLTEPFRLDDQIIVGNFEGTVEEIQTRATLIKTYDGRRIVIPNAQLFTGAVTVNTAFAQRRLEYDLGIGVNENIDHAKSLILEAIRSVDGVLQKPAPDVLVVKLADFSVQLRARWWITPPRRADVLALQDQVLAAIKTTLNTHGVDLPFPTQQILWHDQTEETDGDRTRQREGWPVGQGEVPQPRSIARALETLAAHVASQRTPAPQHTTDGRA
ncbi:MAG: mechanosensitive ion channel family protein [Candidatus Tectimicrobiota bacterium]